MPARDVLAIDFGTANTYYCKCPADQLSPKGVDFGDGRDGLATAILYRTGKSPLIGHDALNTYGEASAQERTSYTLRTHFKPDIASGQEAKRNAADFLAAVVDQASRQRLDIAPRTRQVIFGVPSESGTDYRSALAQIAGDAGYGEITMVDEPKGALLYHLYHKDISVRDAQQGVLVVDFGGGTCDFAFLYRGIVRHSWGDMRLGGRLFDDLFFQWFLDENPCAATAIRQDGTEFFVTFHHCRETKESFSRTMTRDRSEKVVKAIGQYGRLTGMTWERFCGRASRYVPSETFRCFLAEIGQSGSITPGNDGPVDLRTWFRTCLTNGLQEAKIDKIDIRSVLLAGGSSQWPFVRDILNRELGIDEERIIRSDRPYAAISEGLAILPALQAKLRATQKKLREELPGFCNTQLNALLDTRGKHVAEGIAQAMTRELFDERLRPILIRFRTEGGSVASLRDRLASATAPLEPRLRAIIEERVSLLTEGLPFAVKELVGNWFGAHDLAPPEGGMAVRGIDAAKVAKPEADTPDMFREIEKVVQVVGSGVVGLISAAVLGGGGMALLLEGPIGWLIGLVIGVVISYIAIKEGWAGAMRKAETWNVPPWLVKRSLTNKKVSNAREKILTDMESAVRRELAGMQDGISKEVTRIVEREIDALSDIDHM